MGSLNPQSERVNELKDISLHLHSGNSLRSEVSRLRRKSEQQTALEGSQRENVNLK